jgi:hypothetical protein
MTERSRGNGSSSPHIPSAFLFRRWTPRCRPLVGARRRVHREDDSAMERGVWACWAGYVALCTRGSAQWTFSFFFFCLFHSLMC